MRFGFSCVVAAMVATNSYGAGTLYVNASTLRGGGGTSWNSALSNLDIALELAPIVGADQIWVAAGTYIPQYGTNPAASFELQNGVSVYGGFIGNETDVSQRDIVANVTTLSGAGSVMHVVRATNIDTLVRLDGFTITGGVGDDGTGSGEGGFGGAGGGIYLDNSSPTIANCIVTGNAARIGAGVWMLNGNPTFQNCSLSSNSTFNSGEGGAIYARTTVGNVLTILDCVFNNNTAYQQHFATGNGGAIYCGNSVSLIVERSTFNTNYVFHNMTYGDITKGGAICGMGGVVTIKDSKFYLGHAGFGAGIFSIGPLTCINSEFSGNRAVWNGCAGPECNGAPDLGAGHGGGIYAWDGTILNCTFGGNWAAKSGAGVTMNGIVRNCIFWGNVTPPICCGEDALPIVKAQIEGNVDFQYCIVEGMLQQIVGEDPPNPADFPGSHDVDPMFVLNPIVHSGGGWTTLGDLHVQAGSLAIDAGSNADVPIGTLADLDGLSRFADDPNVVDTGVGTGPIVDLGAYEIQSPGIPEDIDGDGVVGVNDLLLIIGSWGACTCPEDLNGDGTVDVTDLLTLIAAWTITP